MRLLATFHPRFAAVVADEIRALDPRATLRRVKAPDVAIVESALTLDALAEALVAAPPIFLRHIVPISTSVELAGTADDLDTIATAALEHLQLEPDQSFAVECRKGIDAIAGVHTDAAYGARDVEIRAGVALYNTGLEIDLRRPAQVVTVYLDGNQAHLGAARVEATLTLFADEARRASQHGRTVSRAEHKIAEAVDVFGLTIAPGTRALDLGASPGGWSGYLARAGATVVAVDPGDLHPDVAGNSGVTHLRQRIENLSFEPGTFDLVVNDMVLDPAESAALMCHVAPFVRPGSPGLMTVKLPSRRPYRGIEVAREVLDHGWRTASVRHLAHNRQEVTLLLERLTSLRDGWQKHVVAGRGRPRPHLKTAVADSLE